MKISFRLMCISASVIFIAWMAKLHFIYGGDYLFRTGTALALISFILTFTTCINNAILKESRLNILFMANQIFLMVVYAGMMMKISHVMNTQFEKDLVLDFLGIPAMCAAIIWNFISAQKLIGATESIKVQFAKFVMMPWIIFLFSFILYAIYSAALAIRQ